MMNTEMNNTNQEIIDKLIVRFADGDINQNELSVLENWVKESNQNQKYFQQFKNILDNSRPDQVLTGDALEKVLSNISSVPINTDWLTILQKVAAILFIPLFISMLWLFLNEKSKTQIDNEKLTSIEAPFGTISSFELQDGSKVWLNAGSSLQFPREFAEGQRNVKLNGEAYFEVHSDEQSPFVVHTKNLSVTATGTRFDVMAYEGRQLSVTLAEGKVNVQTNTSDQKSKKILMRADQHITFNADLSTYEIEFGDAYKHLSWKDGKLIFRNDLLTDIMERISLQYNVDVVITDKKIAQNRYRATFENESLTDVLDLLKLASPFTYQEINPVSLPDGSFTRRKIILTSSKSK
jgi:ferric-dicitrate binding protein FerR (iron transport regulator)